MGKLVLSLALVAAVAGSAAAEPLQTRRGFAVRVGSGVNLGTDVYGLGERVPGLSLAGGASVFWRFGAPTDRVRFAFEIAPLLAVRRYQGTDEAFLGVGAELPLQLRLSFPVGRWEPGLVTGAFASIQRVDKPHDWADKWERGMGGILGVSLAWQRAAEQRLAVDLLYVVDLTDFLPTDGHVAHTWDLLLVVGWDL